MGGKRSDETFLRSSTLTLSSRCSLRKENGTGGSSPFCSSRHEVLIVRASTLGGVPVRVGGWGKGSGRKRDGGERETYREMEEMVGERTDRRGSCREREEREGQDREREGR